MKFYVMGGLLFVMMVISSSGSYAGETVQLRHHLSHLEQQFRYEKQQFDKLRHQGGAMYKAGQQNLTAGRKKQQGTCMQSRLQRQEMKLRKISFEIQNVQRKLRIAMQPAQK